MKILGFIEYVMENSSVEVSSKSKLISQLVDDIICHIKKADIEPDGKYYEIFELELYRRDIDCDISVYLQVSPDPYFNTDLHFKKMKWEENRYRNSGFAIDANTYIKSDVYPRIEITILLNSELHHDIHGVYPPDVNKDGKRDGEDAKHCTHSDNCDYDFDGDIDDKDINYADDNPIGKCDHYDEYGNPQGNNVYGKLYIKLNEILSHELSHLQQIGLNKNPFSEDPHSHSNRKDHKNNYKYFLLPEEIEAMVDGMYRRSKLEGIPIDEVFVNHLTPFLSDGFITPEEMNTIVKVWVVHSLKNHPGAEYSDKYSNFINNI